MSDEMMFGIAKMPYEMAMGDEMSRRQFYANTQRLVEAAKRLSIERAELRCSNEHMRKALEFYADPEIYKRHPHGPAFDSSDLSWRARAALDA